MMTPEQRFLTDPTISPDDKLEDVHWRKRATPDEGEWADTVTRLWYLERDEAALVRQTLEALLGERFG